MPHETKFGVDQRHIRGCGLVGNYKNTRIKTIPDKRSSLLHLGQMISMVNRIILENMNWMNEDYAEGLN